MDAEEPPVLDIRAVAAIIGKAQGLDGPMRPKTISQYLTESRPGGRYEKHPFPKPNGYIGKSPWWAKGREPEFVAWQNGRVGRGVGGGRPRKTERG